MKRIQTANQDVTCSKPRRKRLWKMSALRPHWLIGSVTGAAFAIAFGLAAASEARAELAVTDPDTAFNRLYVVGSGDSPAENSANSADLNLLKSKLEQQGNHKSLNSLSVTNPSLFLLGLFVDSLKNNAKPNDAVTIYFSGRGNEDTFRLRNGVDISAADLATMLTGFAPNVTVVIIMDFCFGGSFVDDLETSADVKVIGTSTTCPFDAPFDDFLQTFAEDVAEQAGDGLADTGDGVVTASELQAALLGLGWKLGPAGFADVIQNGHSKCDDVGGVCVLPTITVTPEQCAATVDVDGDGFDPSINVNLDVLDSDLISLNSAVAGTDGSGMFTELNFAIPAPSTLLAVQGPSNLDWHFCENGGGGPPPPVDDTAPSCDLELVGDTIVGTFQDPESGIADIDVKRARNVTVTVDAFTVGTNAPVMAWADINNTRRRAQVRYEITDVAGNYTICSKSVRRR
jgi:hypothetical protein